MKEETIFYESNGSRVPAFSVTPSDAIGGLVVLHEVWGLVPHIKDVCKRLSKLGFAAVAPNLYWKHEGLMFPAKIQEAMEAVWDLPLEKRYDLSTVKRELAKKGSPEQTLELIRILYNRGFRDQMLGDAISCTQYISSKYGKLGIIGFSMGGGLAARAATKFRPLRSCVVFYGEPPDARDVPKLSGPILLINAEHDDIINSKIPGFVEASMASGKDLTLKLYPETKHGFFNDTNKQVYNREAAEDAWEITKWFLKRTFQ
ncbi:MAG: dienelactone hydrolase family protein [Thaumarchaeota archaeon]|nr:dienelactone hydrolase family protein [Nitrososphaerota archaeon]